MRRRSKTNSRPWEDLEFRYAYMQENPWCEMSSWLVTNLRGEIGGLMMREAATDPHHLIGGNGRRWDVRTNLLSVCRPVHLWCHAHLVDSRILGVWLKAGKGEFDVNEFRKVSGKYLAGWLGINRPTYPVLEPCWEELIRYTERNEPQ